LRGQITFPAAPVIERGFQGNRISNVLPMTVEARAVTTPLSAEIQSVAVRRSGDGTARVLVCDANSQASVHTVADGKVAPVCTLRPIKRPELGWSGGTVRQEDVGRVALASWMGKSLSFFTDGNLVRTAYLPLHPTRCDSVLVPQQRGSLVAVTGPSSGGGGRVGSLR
jgi:hypothetical protein